MTAALCCIAALATLAQANPPVVAPASPPADLIEVLAFQATTEGQATRQVDAALRPLDALLKDMNYDTFRVVMQQRAELPPQTETMVQINDTYALYVLPLGKDEQGILSMQARVTMMQSGKLVNALLTQGQAKPGRAMLFRGLAVPGGELGIVLRLVPPKQDPKDGDQDSQSQDDSQDQQQQQQPQDPSSGGDDQQGDQNASDQSETGEDQKDDSSQKGMANEDKKEGEEEEGESAQAGESSEDTEGEKEGAQGAEPKDLEDIDALLKSLEDQDRREQKSARNNRDSIRFNGDWW